MPAQALSKARRELDLEAMMRDIARSDLAILDEFGYVPLDTESARLLFQVVLSCCESRSMIFATNTSPPSAFLAEKRCFHRNFWP